MKEVRAYVREERAGHVADALAQVGYDFSVLEVRRIARGLARSEYDFSVSLGGEYEKIIKIEVVCVDAEVERVLSLIQRLAATGARGDGMVFVAPVDDALRISNGRRGDAALATLKG